MEVLKYIISHFETYSKRLFLFLFANFFTFILSLILPYLNGFYFDMLIYKSEKVSVICFGLIIVTIGFFSVLLTYLFGIYKSHIQSKLVFEMMNKMIGHIQKTDYREYSKYNAVYLHQRLNTDINRIWNFFFEDIVNSIFRLLTIVIVVVVVCRINVKLLFLVMITVPFYITGYYLLKSPLYEKNKAMKEEQAYLYGHMNEQLEFVKIVKLWSAYKENEAKRQKCFHIFFKTYMDYTRLQALYNSLEGMISIAFKVIALIIGGVEIMSGNMTVGALTIVSSYFSMLIQNIKFFFSFGQSYQNAKSSYDRITELVNLKEECFGEIEMQEKIQGITVENLSFSYGSANVLNEVKQQFRQGLNIIWGDNGKGKTTLIHLLCGLLREDSHKSIYFNDKEISHLDINFIRRNKISIYLQNQTGMNEYVHEMLFEKLHVGREEIISLLKEKALHSLYMTEKFDIRKYLDRRVQQLSGGEMQRLFLLPVLAKEADVLILDEPTSDLDEDSKKILSQILVEKSEHRIVIVITHDRYLFQDAQINIVTL